MFKNMTKKKITILGFLAGLFILIPIDNIFPLIFIFGIAIVLLNYLKNIYYIEGMKTIY